jgi:nicotinic acid phosphoribosyltransferase
MAFAMSLVGKRILDIHQVKVFINKKGDLVLNYEGPIWLRILVETPLLATISELYFRHTMSEEKYAEAHQAGLQGITETAQKMASFPEGFGVTEGGTRRRFSVGHYENVLKALKEHSGGQAQGHFQYLLRRSLRYPCGRDHGSPAADVLSSRYHGTEQCDCIPA